MLWIHEEALSRLAAEAIAMHCRRRPFFRFLRHSRPHSCLQNLEGLEDRCLLSVTISEFALPTTGSYPSSIVSGPDGALWFTETNGNKIGRITTSGTITEFATPTTNAHPQQIVVGSDGALWFTESNVNKIGRITTSGIITEFTVPTSNSSPQGITEGSDGALWFTEANGDKIGRISTSGVFTEYAVPTTNSHPGTITAGPDGALWFVENSGNNIGRISTTGAITEYTIPTANSNPQGIVAGPDGALWFTEFANSANKIGRITVSGVITEYNLTASGANPKGITVGADGALWFTLNDTNSNSIGRITTSGVITQYSIPTSNSLPVGITSGPDGALWFTESNASRIGQAVFDQPLTATGTTIQATEQSTFSGVVVTFTDPDMAALSSSYAVSINWGDGTSTSGTVSGNNGQFQVTGTHTYAEDGTYSVTVAIQDAGYGSVSGGASATATSSAHVADAALVSNQSSQTLPLVETGSTGSVVVATFADAGTDGTAADYTATIRWGDGTTSTGIVALVSGDTFSVSGNHTYADEGNYVVQVLIQDVGGASITTSSTGIAVSDAPLSAQGATQTLTATEGASTGSQMLATFTDPGGDGTVADYIAILAWGDGLTSIGTITAGAGGIFRVSGSHVYGEEGSYAVQVTIEDVGGSVATTSGTTFNVADAALSATGNSLNTTEGSALQDILANFTDVDPGGVPSDFTATIYWGDGTRSTGTVLANGQGGFAVHGSHVYTTAGVYTATIYLNDSGGSTAQASAIIRVADASLYGSGLTVNTSILMPFSGALASFSDANPYGQAGQFTAQINWGDGTRSLGNVTSNGQGGFNVSGLHLYVLAGAYTATITVQDVDGASVVIQSAVNVSELSGTGANVTAVEGTSWSGLVADFSNPQNPNAPTSQYTATINWGDGSTSAGVVSPDGNGGVAVHGSHTYVEAGSYPVAVSIQWSGGLQGTAVDNARVADAALQASGTTFDSPLGTTLSYVVAKFNDGSLQSPSTDFTATITWGDGTVSSGIVQALGQGHFQVLGTHEYFVLGTYGVTVQVNDEDGSTVTASSIAYVPDAPLTGSGTHLTGAAGQNYTGLVATFTDGNPASTAADYVALITWGDGTTSTGTVVSDSRGGFEVLGSKAYAVAGDYTVMVSIRDHNGAFANVLTTASVSGASGNSAGTSSTSSTSSWPPEPVSLPLTPAPAQPAAPPSPILLLASAVGSSVFASESSSLTPGTTIDRISTLVPLRGSAADATPAPSAEGDSDTNNPSNSSARPRAYVAVTPPVANPPTIGMPLTPPSLMTAPVTVGTVPVPSARVTPHLESPQLTRALDQLKHDVEQHRQRPAWAIDAVFATGAAAAGYVALTTRAASWLMTALLSRPLWREFDPIEILFAWEAEKTHRTRDGEQDETLQSLVTARS